MEPMKLLTAVLILLSYLRLTAADFNAGFDQANKLYEQGKYEQAAAAYEALIQQGAISPAIYFNLGNAWFKAGQTGRAIAAYREAEELAPRDPSVRFNLQFARKKVTGSEMRTGENWRAIANNLTLNEWTTIAVISLWIWFLVLILREVRPSWRASLRNTSIVLGLVFLIAAGLLYASYQNEAHANTAVVVSTNAVVRYGPLDESQVFYQLRDGSEVNVLDEKRTGEKQSWLQVQDASRRTGWLKKQDVIVINGGNGISPAT
jgi:tetratricopeptide (TPR) repeat protein